MASGSIQSGRLKPRACSKPAVPNLFGTRNQLWERVFLQIWVGRMVLVWFKCITFIVHLIILCCCSVAKSCLTLQPLDCSMLCFPVLYHLPEIAPTLVHWVSDAIQPSHPLLSPPSPVLFLHCDIQWDNYTTHHNAESLAALNLCSCNYMILSGGDGKQWHLKCVAYVLSPPAVRPVS